MKKYEYERKVVVNCSKCGGTFNEEDVKFENIEEDIYGYDVLTFICPECNHKVKSHRRG